MTKRNLFLFIGLIIFITIFIFHKQITTHLKIILFITEEFPQIPLKPLGLLTKAPTYKKVELSSINGKIVADLFIPQAGGKHDAVILALGVKTQEKDKKLILEFAQTMARLGYVTLWPRLETIAVGESLPEEPQTFIESFKYLERLQEADPERIMFVGFSVGSSTAFVASADPEISDKVYGLVFFGGFYDIFDYLLALDNKTPWKPHQDAINHSKTLLAAKGIATDSAKPLDSEDAERLRKYSPREFVWDFKSKIFILHDKSDVYVPYTESVELYEILPKYQIEAYHISDLFDHVQPNRPLNVRELVKLYGFLYKVFSPI